MYAPVRKGRGSISKVLRLAAAEAGIDVRVGPQVLRYTANTLLREAATGELTRSVIGHTTDRMTGHYYRATPEAQREALDGVASALEG